MAKGGNRTKQRKHSNWIQRTEMSNECAVRANRATCEQKSNFQTEVHVPHPSTDLTVETPGDLQPMVTVRLLPPQEDRDCIHLVIEQY